MVHILDVLKDRVLLCDGGTGSRVQALTLDVERDYLGHENCTEILNVSRSDLVRGLHQDYLKAGSDLIQTNSFGGGTLVNSFLPDGAKPFGTGRGVEIVGNKIYYTEATGSAFLPGPTDSIRIAPYNQGAGGADITTIPNPRSGYMVQDLDYDSTNSILYVLTGYYWDTVPQVFGVDPLSGAIVRGPINVAVPGRGDIAGPGSADGFTLLPNGNFLINNYTTSCTYNQYDSSTGALIPNTTITLPGINCTGVDTDRSEEHTSELQSH